MATRRKLGAKWQLDAALLSRPVDLTTLVSMSLSDPQEFFKDDTLHRMVKLLLNEGNERRSNHHTKLDVLGILSNLARDPSQSVKDEIKMILQGVSEWFDEYLQSEPVGGVDADGVPIEPEMHKTMLLVLSRTYDYALRTEDLLELSGGDRQTALVTVVALLEDGETYTTALTQRQMAGEGRVHSLREAHVASTLPSATWLHAPRLLLSPPNTAVVVVVFGGRSGCGRGVERIDTLLRRPVQRRN